MIEYEGERLALRSFGARRAKDYYQSRRLDYILESFYCAFSTEQQAVLHQLRKAIGIGITLLNTQRPPS